MSVWTVVCAGGVGHRFGAAKQYAELGGQRLVDHAVANAAAASDFVVVGAPAVDVTSLASSLAETAAAVKVIAGGVLRSDTVRAALAVIPQTVDVIVVHDAARPLAPPSLFAAVIGAVQAGADAAVPGIAPADTVKRVAGDVVVETIERSELVLVQTPQAFRADALRAAHVGAPDATDDAALVERASGKVVVVAGSPLAAKVTTPDDLVAMTRWLEQRA